MITDGLNPVTVLLFVGAVLGGAALVVLFLVARVTQRQPFARLTLRTLIAGAGLYALLVLGASLFSRSRVLAPGEEKHICEIDCHLAYSVTDTKSEPLPDGHPLWSLRQGGYAPGVATAPLLFVLALVVARQVTARLPSDLREDP